VDRVDWIPLIDRAHQVFCWTRATQPSSGVSVLSSGFNTLAEGLRPMPNDNLVVIAAMARKRGSGKTTLSRALISAAVAAGRRVLLIDTDSTGVPGTWPKRAEAAGLGSPLLRSATVESVGAVDPGSDLPALVIAQCQDLLAQIDESPERINALGTAETVRVAGV
jgi:Mrp family chromosome partitioning ATPase